MMSKTNKKPNERLPLFRGEVLSAGKNQWLGPILLEPRLSPIYLLSAILVILVSAFLLMMFTSYSRKATVPGTLVPDVGLVRVMAPFAGVVTTLEVAEGQMVKKGDILLSISAEGSNDNGVKLSETVLKSLRSQNSLVLREKAYIVAREKRQLVFSKKRIDQLKFQIEAMRQEIEIVKLQISTSKKTLDVKQRNFKNQLSAKSTVEEAENVWLYNRAELYRLKQRASELNLDLVEAMDSVVEIPLQREADLIAIDKQLLDIEQQLARNSAGSKFVIVAPVTGVISSIQLNMFSAAPLNVPLMTIIPKNSKLVAHLYAPSSSIGLVTKGDSVRIRYDAYPYQRFGLFNGQITTVSQSALGSTELAPQIASFSEINIQEPIYRIVVELEKNAFTNGSKLIPLQVGLKLQADIFLDSRLLYQWLYDFLVSSARK